ncbi:MAG: hypothetical protein EZS28_027233 [Streblomastix strix]|uniref:Uncharacterized protein n=1 Tax=Streblomastix strix TaxID=222440 RepID=A0A5J4V4H4_9EUKA|nr:MAG: hypothetical protein EZS28_027233 [Streblomastix strix]
MFTTSQAQLESSNIIKVQNNSDQFIIQELENIFTASAFSKEVKNQNIVASSGFLPEPEDLQVTASFIEYRPNQCVRSSKISKQVSRSPEFSQMLMGAGASQGIDGSSSQSNESGATQPLELAISVGANDESQSWIQAYMGTNFTPEEVMLRKLHREQTSAVLANYYGRKMEEVDP